jgi:hypothetical protein
MTKASTALHVRGLQVLCTGGRPFDPAAAETAAERQHHMLKG